VKLSLQDCCHIYMVDILSMPPPDSSHFLIEHTSGRPRAIAGAETILRARGVDPGPSCVHVSENLGGPVEEMKLLPVDAATSRSGAHSRAVEEPESIDLNEVCSLQWEDAFENLLLVLLKRSRRWWRVAVALLAVGQGGDCLATSTDEGLVLHPFLDTLGSLLSNSYT
jgi:hypothetical protein